MRPLLDENDDSRQAWEMAAGSPQFLPTNLGKVSAWLRLAASSQASSEWTPSIVDVLNANPVTQTDTDRRAAVGVTANGYPTMVFDGTDVHVWPLSAAVQNMTTKLGFWIWFKPASIASVQHLVFIGAPAASAQKFDIYANNAQVFVEVYASGTIGRFGRTGNVLVAGTWSAVYIQYDSSRGGDANLAIFHNGASQSLTYGNLGAGAAMTTLPAPTGDALVGGATNSDTPTQPIANGGEIGPNLFTLNDNLTAAEIAAVLGFEAPV